MLGCRECPPDAPKYVSVDDLEIHITLDHLDFSPYECERCRFGKFPTLYALKMHYREVHQQFEFYVRYKYSEEYERKVQEAKLRLHQCIQETTHSEEGPERSGESTPMPASPSSTPLKFKRQKNACPRSASATVQQTSRLASQAMTTSGLRVNGFQFFEGPKGFMHLRSNNSEKVDYKKILTLKWPAEVLSLTTPPHPALSVEKESFMYLIKAQKYKGALPDDLTSDALRPWTSTRAGRKMRSRSTKVLILNDQIVPARFNDETDFELREYYGDNPSFDRLNKKIHLVYDVKDGSVYNEVAAVVYTYKYAGEVIDLNLLSTAGVSGGPKTPLDARLKRKNLYTDNRPTTGKKFKVEPKFSDKETLRDLLREFLPSDVPAELPQCSYRSETTHSEEGPERSGESTPMPASPSSTPLKFKRQKNACPRSASATVQQTSRLASQAMTTSGLRVNGFQFFEGPKGFMHLRSNNSEKVDYKKILTLKWPAEVLSLTTPPHPALSVEKKSFMYLIKAQKYEGALPDDLTSDALRPWTSTRAGRKMRSRSTKVLILNDQIVPARFNDETYFELREYYGDNPSFDRLNKKIHLVYDVKDGSVYNEVAAVVYTYKYAGEVIDLNLLSTVKLKFSDKELVRDLLRDNLPGSVAALLPQYSYRSVQAIASNCPVRKRAKNGRRRGTRITATRNDNDEPGDHNYHTFLNNQSRNDRCYE